MKKELLKYVGVAFVLGLIPCVQAQAEPYMSKNNVCVVEKKGDGYFFFNNNEMKSREKKIFGKATRDQFEWFYIEKGNPQDVYYLIKAKVHPQMRDAIINAPETEMATKIMACPLTQDNQRLAQTVSYAYVSKDKVCVCLEDNGKTNCQVSPSALRDAPSSKWVPFFETSVEPSAIVGVVPNVVFQAILSAPRDYRQKMVPCENNASNQALVDEYYQSKS